MEGAKHSAHKTKGGQWGHKGNTTMASPGPNKRPKGGKGGPAKPRPM